MMESFWIHNKIDYRKFRQCFSQLMIESPNHGFSPENERKGNYRNQWVSCKFRFGVFSHFSQLIVNYRKPAAVRTRACCNGKKFSLIVLLTIFFYRWILYLGTIEHIETPTGSQYEHVNYSVTRDKLMGGRYAIIIVINWVLPEPCNCSSWKIIISISGFPKMVVPINYWFSY